MDLHQFLVSRLVRVCVAAAVALFFLAGIPLFIELPQRLELIISVFHFLLQVLPPYLLSALSLQIYVILRRQGLEVLDLILKL